MSKQKLTKIIITAVCVVVLAFSGFAYIRTLQDSQSHEEIVREFWQLVLNNEMEKAKFLINDYEPELLSIDPQEVWGTGKPLAVIDGKEIDSFYKDYIYENQIKIERIKDEQVRDYRAGMKLETVDKNGRKNEYLVCLAQTKLPGNPWKIYSISPWNVFGEKETIEKECFEKPKQKTSKDPI
jgi:hypothetical protein